MEGGRERASERERERGRERGGREEGREGREGGREGGKEGRREGGRESEAGTWPWSSCMTCRPDLVSHSRTVWSYPPVAHTCAPPPAPSPTPEPRPAAGSEFSGGAALLCSASLLLAARLGAVKDEF